RYSELHAWASGADRRLTVFVRPIGKGPFLRGRPFSFVSRIQRGCRPPVTPVSRITFFRHRGLCRVTHYPNLVTDFGKPGVSITAPFCATSKRRNKILQKD